MACISDNESVKTINYFLSFIIYKENKIDIFHTFVHGINIFFLS